jgi:hypothetical protein
MRPEYKLSDFKEKLVRGKYYKRFKESSNVAILEPDVAKYFSTPEEVNRALRGLIDKKSSRTASLRVRRRARRR